MGRSYTPIYCVVIEDKQHPSASLNKSTFAWLVKEKGKATDANLEQFILAYGKSLESGGVNAHLSESLGYIPYPHKAKIIRQATSEVVATWQAGAFQVW